MESILEQIVWEKHRAAPWSLFNIIFHHLSLSFSSCDCLFISIARLQNIQFLALLWNVAFQSREFFFLIHLRQYIAIWECHFCSCHIAYSALPLAFSAIGRCSRFFHTNFMHFPNQNKRNIRFTYNSPFFRIDFHSWL